MTATATARIDTPTDMQRLFRRVMGHFTTGVTVVTTRLNEDIFGMTANAFMAGSLDPLLCVVSISRKAQMHDRLMTAQHYGVSFLSREQQHFAAHFAGRRLDHLAPDFDFCGQTPILKRAVAAVTADVVDTAACGDHTLFIGRITSMTTSDGARPLLFYAGRYAEIDFLNPIENVEPPEFW